MSDILTNRPWHRWCTHPCRAGLPCAPQRRHRMTKLSISALAAAIAFAFAGTAAAGDKANANANANANKPMTETTAPVDTTAPETAAPNHGQAVSSVAQSDDLTTDTRGEAVSTMAH